LAGSYSVDISCHGSSMLRPWFIALVAAGAIERIGTWSFHGEGLGCVGKI
jgi:hypothetical protein